MQTTEMYTRADPSVKLEALEAMIAPKLRSGRFKATDKLIASLTSHQNPDRLAHRGGGEVELTGLGRRRQLPVLPWRPIAGFQTSTEGFDDVRCDYTVGL